MLRILVQEGGNMRMLGTLFKVVVQVVILFGSETWVMNPQMGLSLGGSQYRVTYRITGRNPRRL